MKTYRMNAVIAGVLYFLGTVFGILSAVIGGEVLSSLNVGKPLVGVDMLGLVATNSSRITGGAFLILMMGISLVAMTIFLYPIFRKDSEELAMGMVLFRGALEGTGNIISVILWVLLAALSKEFAGTDSATLHTVGNLVLEVSNKNGDILTVFFIIGALCLYTSFYRTRLIPRWLTLWGFIGAVPYLVYGLMSLFNIDGTNLGFLQLPLFLQELAMGLWLVVKGFNPSAIAALSAKTE